MKGFNKTMLETIYFKGIFPSITYYISVWGSSNSIQDLEDLHIIRAAWNMHNIKDSAPKLEVLNKVKWSSISNMYKGRLACIAYQI